MTDRSRSLLAILAGLLSILLAWSIGVAQLAEFALDLGSIGFPTPRHAAFLLVYLLFGSAAVVLLARGAGRLLEPRAPALLARVRALDDRIVIAGGAAFAFALSVLVRILVLHEAPLTDDEPSYRFMAELVASGRLHADSHPLKLFFDRTFMVNDGKVYSQYFIGWPLLMAPGAAIGLSGFMNALYSALTVPPLFLVARATTGRAGALLAVVLFVTSPLLVFGAATELSHTSCLFAIAWAHFFLVRIESSETARPLDHAGFGLAFALAFAIRPTSALGIGLPWLLFLTLDLRRRRAKARALPVAAFVLAAGLVAALFLGAIAIQTGDALHPPYQRVLAYYAENAWRFSNNWVGKDVTVVNFSVGSPMELLSHLGVALLRLDFALFGWPVSLLFLFFAPFARATRAAWASFFTYLLVHLPVADAGVDSFGPVHYTELAWPVLLLTASGVSHLAQGSDESGTPPRLSLAVALVASSMATALLLYVPVRTRALAEVADMSRRPLAAVAELGPSVVFAARPFSRVCAPPGGVAPSSYLLFMPPNDPDFENEVLWANHLSVARDRELMRHFPDREGYLLRWDGCEPVLVPIDDPRADAIPNGLLRLHSTPMGMIAETYPDWMDPSGALPPDWNPRSGPPLVPSAPESP